MSTGEYYQDELSNFSPDEDEEWPDRPDPEEVVDAGMMDGSPAPWDE